MYLGPTIVDTFVGRQVMFSPLSMLIFKLDRRITKLNIERGKNGP